MIYRDIDMEIDLKNKSYETNLPEDKFELEEQEESLRGFNRTGILRLKNIIDKIEYHLYDNKLSYPVCAESIDLNEKFRMYLYSNMNQPIHISISDKNGIIFSGTGRLKRIFRDGIEKFLLEGYDIVDLEEILFNNTEKTITIKINVIHFFEIDNVANAKGDKGNEPRKNKENNKN